MTYYTVDGGSQYAEGMTIELRSTASQFGPNTPPEFVAGAEVLCPRGVSAHGKRYLIDVYDPETQPEQNNDAFCEIVFELERRAGHRRKPSRFESLFGLTSLDDARRFRAEYRSADAPIFEVEAGPRGALWRRRSRVFRADLRLLGIESTPLVTAVYARAYWAGEPNFVKPPLWEVLIPLPARLGRRVTDDDRDHGPRSTPG